MSEIDDWIRQQYPEVGNADVPEIIVHKASGYIPISEELAMDYGLIPDTRPPVRYTRRQRFRWWRQALVARYRLRLGSRIAGVQLDDFG